MYFIQEVHLDKIKKQPKNNLKETIKFLCPFKFID